MTLFTLTCQDCGCYGVYAPLPTLIYCELCLSKNIVVVSDE